jgi:predicted nucleic acid-binding protein
VRFWDTSALVPLVIEQPASARAKELFAEDPGMVAWWATPVECWSALARLRRGSRLSQHEEDAAGELVQQLRDSWTEVLPSDDIRQRAWRLLQVHALRAADAMQLSAALTFAGSPPEGGFVAFDERLRQVARQEGLTVYGGLDSASGGSR